MQDQQPIADEDRRVRLDMLIQDEIRRGGQIATRTDYSYTVRTPEHVNHTLHLILTVLTLGLWGLIWILIVLNRGASVRTVRVDEYGEVYHLKVTPTAKQPAPQDPRSFIQRVERPNGQSS